MAVGSGLAPGLLAGFALDAAFADPVRWHPVAGFGKAAARLEQLVWADRRGRGLAFWSLCVGSTVSLSCAAQRLSRGRRATDLLTTALVGRAVIGGAGLTRTATAIAADLAAADEPAARRRLPHLCGRDPDGMDAAGIVRATIESVAENTSDAVVAPLFWGAVLGLPGLVGYRVVNTLDAMVGHRSPRYARFGWAAARADDLANLLPARLTAALFAGAAPVVGGSARRAWAVARRDARSHPSPNGGWCEAAAAGALGVQLGGTNFYAGRVEHRGLLGDGARPATGDIARAVRLCRTASAASVGLAVTLAGLRAHRGDR